MSLSHDVIRLQLWIAKHTYKLSWDLNVHWASPFGKCTFEIKPQRVKLHFIRTTINKCTVWISGIFPQPFRFVLKRMCTFYIVIWERNSISSSLSHTPPSHHAHTQTRVRENPPPKKKTKKKKEKKNQTKKTTKKTTTTTNK